MRKGLLLFTCLSFSLTASAADLRTSYQIISQAEQETVVVVNRPLSSSEVESTVGSIIELRDKYFALREAAVAALEADIKDVPQEQIKENIRNYFFRAGNIGLLPAKMQKRPNADSEAQRLLNLILTVRKNSGTQSDLAYIQRNLKFMIIRWKSVQTILNAMVEHRLYLPLGFFPVEKDQESCANTWYIYEGLVRGASKAKSSAVEAGNYRFPYTSIQNHFASLPLKKETFDFFTNSPKKALLVKCHEDSYALGDGKVDAHYNVNGHVLTLFEDAGFSARSGVAPSASAVVEVLKSAMAQ